MSVAEFHKMQRTGGLLESASIFKHAYGTPKKFVTEEIKKGKTVILAIDVQGTQGVKKKAPSRLLTIFVLPPSVKVLRERLENRRTETPEEIDRRIQVSQEEIKAASLYDHTVVNQNLDQTVVEIEGLIEKFRKSRNSNTHSK
jgi:guanylate kinase